MGNWAAGRGGRPPQGPVCHAVFLPQGSPAQRTTTSCGHPLMRGATSVCWDTRLFSSGGRRTPRASTEKTSTGLCPCPTAPAPARTTNGWSLTDAGRSCVPFSAGWGPLGSGPVVCRKEGKPGNTVYEAPSVSGSVPGSFCIGGSVPFQQPCAGEGVTAWELR